MPVYVKFMKELLSNERKLEDVETITLNEEYSAAIQCKISIKLKDPGSFSIPSIIGPLKYAKSLCNFGCKCEFDALLYLLEIRFGWTEEATKYILAIGR